VGQTLSGLLKNSARSLGGGSGATANGDRDGPADACQRAVSAQNTARSTKCATLVFSRRVRRLPAASGGHPHHTPSSDRPTGRSDRRPSVSRPAQPERYADSDPNCPSPRRQRGGAVEEWTSRLLDLGDHRPASPDANVAGRFGEGYGDALGVRGDRRRYRLPGPSDRRARTGLRTAPRLRLTLPVR